MTVNYQVSQNGMSAAVAIPHVVVHDTRPGTPEKSRIVMCASTSRRMEQGLNQGPRAPNALTEATPWPHVADQRWLTNAVTSAGLSDISPSMVVVEYMTNVHEATATVNMRLQNPTFIAEMGFVLALSSFVGTNSKAARDYINSDILLTSRVTCAAGDLWLSPDCRFAALAH